MSFYGNVKLTIFEPLTVTATTTAIIIITIKILSYLLTLRGEITAYDGILCFIFLAFFFVISDISGHYFVYKSSNK